ncbi:hypothetical protein AB0I98_49735 [Streptomyces sp. NPDC050211]|uniref:hypothetical protein n=1 Tax=Streptomyces sp. NPDC050211 TaxID=3154932 RepID=UPI0034307771
MAAIELKDAGVVVPGTGAGIRSALARRFAAAGARLVINDLDADAAARGADELGGLGRTRRRRGGVGRGRPHRGGA